jgi:molybdate transport system substrate-binding protein
MAIPSGHARPHIHDEASLRLAVQQAQRIGYSTGPSGAYLEQLFERWGLSAEVKAKLAVPAPGVPVGRLIASGEVSLGFQQRSELINLKGIDLLGDLPADVAHTTIFSSALGLTLSQDPDRLEATRQWQSFLMSDATAQVKLSHGMRPISHST